MEIDIGALKLKLLMIEVELDTMKRYYDKMLKEDHVEVVSLVEEQLVKANDLLALLNDMK